MHPGLLVPSHVAAEAITTTMTYNPMGILIILIETSSRCSESISLRVSMLSSWIAARKAVHRDRSEPRQLRFLGLKGRMTGSAFHVCVLG
jgi:hypothetical protein